MMYGETCLPNPLSESWTVFVEFSIEAITVAPNTGVVQLTTDAYILLAISFCKSRVSFCVQDLADMTFVSGDRWFDWML